MFLNSPRNKKLYDPAFKGEDTGFAQNFKAGATVERTTNAAYGFEVDATEAYRDALNRYEDETGESLPMIGLGDSVNDFVAMSEGKELDAITDDMPDSPRNRDRQNILSNQKKLLSRGIDFTKNISGLRRTYQFIEDDAVDISERASFLGDVGNFVGGMVGGFDTERSPLNTVTLGLGGSAIKGFKTVADMKRAKQFALQLSAEGALAAGIEGINQFTGVADNRRQAGLRQLSTGEKLESAAYAAGAAVGLNVAGAAIGAGARQARKGVGKVQAYRKDKAEFDNIAQFVMDDLEGGAQLVTDTGGLTKYGISQKANPDADVKNLTRQKALKKYRKDYWNAIKADDLPDDMKAIAFDTAVNHGAGKAKELLKEAANNPQKLMELRRAEYQRLATENPEKYGAYLNGWNNRLDKLEAQYIEAAATATQRFYAKQVEDFKAVMDKRNPLHRETLNQLERDAYFLEEMNPYKNKNSPELDILHEEEFYNALETLAIKQPKAIQVRDDGTIDVPDIAIATKQGKLEMVRGAPDLRAALESLSLKIDDVLYTQEVTQPKLKDFSKEVSEQAATPQFLIVSKKGKQQIIAGQTLKDALLLSRLKLNDLSYTMELPPAITIPERKTKRFARIEPIRTQREEYLKAGKAPNASESLFNIMMFGRADINSFDQMTATKASKTESNNPLNVKGEKATSNAETASQKTQPVPKQEVIEITPDEIEALRQDTIEYGNREEDVTNREYSEMVASRDQADGEFYQTIYDVDDEGMVFKRTLDDVIADIEADEAALQAITRCKI